MTWNKLTLVGIIGFIGYAVVIANQGATYRTGNVISTVDVLPMSCADRDIVVLNANPPTIPIPSMNICVNGQFTSIIPASVLAFGTTLPVNCISGAPFVRVGAIRGQFYCDPDNTWNEVGVPSGLITLITSGSCLAGWTEINSLNGRMLRGTLAANGNVGVIGGADNHSHTYTDVVQHNHSFSDLRGLGTGTMNTTYAGLSPGTDATSTPIALVSDNSGVGMGTTLTADNRPAYTNVIFCQKN